MPHIRTLSAVVTGSLLVFGPGATTAQQIPSPYRFIEEGQEAGVLSGFMSLETGRFGFGPKSAPFYGGMYSVALSSALTLEGTAVVIETERDVVNPRLPAADRVLPDPAEMTLLSVIARLRFNLTGRRTWHGFQPFAVAGAGAMSDLRGDQVEDERLDPNEQFDFGTEFTGIFGGGVRWFPTGRLAVRGEAGITLYQLDIPNGWRDPDLGLGDAPESEWLSAGTFTVGATLLF